MARHFYFMINYYFKNNFSNFFYIYLPLKKLINEKYFSIKKIFSLVLKKFFSFYLSCDTFSRSYKKLKKYHTIY